VDCRLIQNYIESLLKYPHPLLKELYTLAKKEKFPVVEPSVGQLIYFFTKLVKPRIIVEFGSGFGYSLLWSIFALLEENLKEFQIYAVDYQEKNKKRALEIFKKLKVEKYISYLIGDAQTIFTQVGFEKESIDLIIFDHEKQNYSDSLDLVLPYLKKGGIIITDDILWKGKVALSEEKNIRISSLRFFNKEILQREDLVSFICPIGDGVAVIMKR
jgi:caffeoyl-CoA O-methyltransferase